MAVQVMAELGVDISGQRSKSVEEFRGAESDLVVTVCDNAARNCPLWLGRGQVKHIGLPDPAAASGSEAERLEAFRQVRDAIREQALGYLTEGFSKSPTVEFSSDSLP
jgi:arsenate reductase